MSEELTALQTRIGYQFRLPSLLEMAVTHPSYLPAHPDTPDSNQRLEFLGDAVLQLVLTEALFQLYPDEREGALTQMRKKLVEGRFTARLARELGLEHCLRVAADALSVAGNKSALEDAFEALVAAVYLDGGYDRARDTVLGIYGDLAPRLASTLPADNPKGRLQESVQPVHGNDALRYEVVATTGEAHAREYEVVVWFKDQPVGRGRGSSKKAAEEAAARAALDTLAANPPA